MERTKAVFNWSGGKDSAHALWHAIESQHYEIVALLTTVNHDTRRSTMHGIPFPLLQAQAASIGIPLHAVDLTPKGDMEDYQTAMSQAVAHFKAQGVTHFIFGDIFLHDVRKYREQQLAPHGIEVVEPLWGRSSETVMHDFLASGLQTVVVTTMADGLGAAAIGRTIDSDFIASLPAGTDPNGENGEYHTFCYDGPIFRTPVRFRLGSPFSRSYDIRLDHGENLHLLVRRSARAISHLYRRHFRWYALWLLPESAPHRTRLTEIRTNRRFRQPRKTYTYDNQNHPAPKNKPLLPITRTAGPGTPDSRMQRHPGK